MGFLLTLGLFLFTFVVTELLKPDPASDFDPDPFKAPTSTEGRVVPLIWGTVEITAPNVLWFGYTYSKKIRKRVRRNAFSSSRVTIGHRYFVAWNVGICRGPLTGTYDGFRRIRVDDREVWSWPNSETNSSPQVFTTLAQTSRVSINLKNFFGDKSSYRCKIKTNRAGYGGAPTRGIRFYPGSETQLLDTDHAAVIANGGTTDSITAAVASPPGRANIPPYRGTAHIWATHNEIGNGPTMRPMKVTVTRIPNGLGLSASEQILNNHDANPMNVVYEIMTNTDWGLALSPGQINTTSFTAAASTLATENNGFSMELNTEKKVAEVLRIVEKQVDGVLYQNPVDGRYEFNLTREGAAIPSPARVMDDSNVVSVEFSRTSWEDTVNQVRVRYKNPDDNYKETFAFAQDMGNLELQQQNVIRTIEHPGCKNSILANQLAWRSLRTLSQPIASITVRCNREFYDLRPTDRFQLTWSPLGNELPNVWRVTRVNYGEFQNGIVTINAVEDIFTDTQTAFAPPDPSDWVPFPGSDVSATAEGDAFIIEAPFIISVADVPNAFPRVMVGAFLQPEAGEEYDLQTEDRTPPTAFNGTWLANGYSDQIMIKGTLRAQLDGPAQGGPLPTTFDFDLDEETDLDSLLQEDPIAPSVNDLNFQTVAVINPGTVNEEWVSWSTLAEIIVSPDVGGAGRATTLTRGLMDRMPKTHGIGSPIFFLGGSGYALTDGTFATSDAVRARIIPRTADNELDEASATVLPTAVSPQEIIILDPPRYALPLIPADLIINGTSWDTSVDIDANVEGVRSPLGFGSPTAGIIFEWTMRNYENPNLSSQNAGQNEDLSTYTPGSGGDPAVAYDWWLYNITGSPLPFGSPTRGSAILNGTVTNDSFLFISRTQIEAAVSPQTSPRSINQLRIEIEARHTELGFTDAVSLEPLIHDFTVS